MSFLSETLARISPSPTVAMTQRARALAEAGRDIIGLAAGEPDFDTPEHVKDAAIAAIGRGETKYTAPDGMPELKRAIADKFARENGLSYGAAEIIVGTGGKQVLYNALLATLNPGDEVVIPAPYWVSYPDIVRLGGGVPVIVETRPEAGFKMDADALAGAITPSTKWVILNSPANPTGAVYSADELRALTEVVARHPTLWILADDIYEHIVHDGRRFATPAEVAPELRARILTVNGVSKGYAMTGWRIGYAGGPAPLIRAMAKLQSQSTTNPASISQWAAVAALDGPQDGLRTRQAAFQGRRDRLVGALDAVPGLSCARPEGAFYVFPDVRGTFGKTSAQGHRIDDDLDFAEALLEETGVALVPGQAFGLSGFVRISYATSQEQLDRAAARIAQFCDGLMATG